MKLQKRVGSEDDCSEPTRRGGRGHAAWAAGTPEPTRRGLRGARVRTPKRPPHPTPDTWHPPTPYTLHPTPCQGPGPALAHQLMPAGVRVACLRRNWTFSGCRMHGGRAQRVRTWKGKPPGESARSTHRMRGGAGAWVQGYVYTHTHTHIHTHKPSQNERPWRRRRPPASPGVLFFAGANCRPTPPDIPAIAVDSNPVYSMWLAHSQTFFVCAHLCAQQTQKNYSNMIQLFLNVITCNLI